MPPLRERVADIPLLVEYFIDRFGKRAGKKFRTIDKKSLKTFQSYSWPGNVRELQNVIERAVILSEGDTLAVDETWLKLEALPTQPRTRTLDGALVRQEKGMIEAVLAESQGRISGPAGAASWEACSESLTLKRRDPKPMPGRCWRPTRWCAL
jgi:formate hydrogenlyase transcriptional activator